MYVCVCVYIYMYIYIYIYIYDIVHLFGLINDYVDPKCTD